MFYSLIINYFSSIDDKWAWWSQWISSILFITGVIFIGNYALIGPVINFIASLVFLIFVIKTRTWGLLMLDIVLGITYIRTFIIWHNNGTTIFGGGF
jgi:hypothetical protein